MVEIPEEKAIIIAEHHRAQAQAAPTPANAQWHREVADLLDSQPPTLREQVAATLRDKQSDATSWKQDANAVLAVVAEAVRQHRHPDEPDFPSMWWEGYYQAKQDIYDMVRGTRDPG